jgi:D-3-phosphoglycerate dehydrogenase / 2-oxoglutarate reductase
MSKYVLLTASDYSDGSLERKILEPLGITLKIVHCKTEEEVIDAGKEAIGLLVTYTPIREKVMSALRGLKIIVRCGIGVDNLDLDKAKEYGIRVCNVPDYCLDEVADHAMALLLALERQILLQNNDIKNKEWKGIKRVQTIRGLQGSVLGIVGLGQIGRKVASRAQAFGLRTIAYDPYFPEKNAGQFGVTLKSFDDLLSESDFISLHPPLTNDNFHLFNANTFTKMKSTAYLINTSRGPLIDRQALLNALLEHKISGVGLDVIEDDLEGTLELSKLDNVIITPHTAWFSQNSFIELKKRSAEEIARFLRGEQLLHSLV